MHVLIFESSIISCQKLHGIVSVPMNSPPDPAVSSVVLYTNPDVVSYLDQTDLILLNLKPSDDFGLVG